MHDPKPRLICRLQPDAFEINVDLPDPVLPITAMIDGSDAGGGMVDCRGWLLPLVLLEDVSGDMLFKSNPDGRSREL